MSDKKRLDQILLDKKLVESRTRAQELIKSGHIFILNQNGQKTLAEKASQLLHQDIQIEISESELSKYVSRGGLKLEGALLRTQLNVTGKIILDVGLSTGGFSDCLLQKGASNVIGVDVGSGQTHPTLVKNPKLQVHEKINARNLSSYPDVIKTFPKSGFDLVVMDVSFISITLILPEISHILQKGQRLLSLVKPQFEVGPEGLGKGGLVKEASLYQEVEFKIKKACDDLKLKVLDYFVSPIEGKDGNKEFFIFAEKE